MRRWVAAPASLARATSTLHHLPKVGTPANQQWEHETHKKVMFGSTLGMVIIGVVAILVVAGLLLLTL